MHTFLHTILQAVGISHTATYTEGVYMTEPKPNTLLGLKRMLMHYGVASKGVRTNVERLRELAFPYILHVKDEFILVSQPKDLTEQMLTDWDGIVLYITDKSNAIEPDFSKHRRQQFFDRLLYGWILILPIVCVVLGGEYSLFSLLSIAGMILSVLLLQKQLGVYSQFGDKICNMFQKSGCDDVLNSSKSKVFGVFSLSEIGLGYFWTQLLLLGLSFSMIPFLQLIAIIGLFVPVWSIYRQWKMGRWCGLCLLVQVVLLLQGIPAVCMGLEIHFSIQYVLWLLFTILALLAGIFGIHLVVNGIVHRRDLLHAQWNLHYMMRNPDVFQALMQQSVRYAYLSEDVTETFGNAAATHRVTVYMSHTCKYCIALKPQLDTFIQKQGSRFAIDVIYTDHLTEEQQHDFSVRTGLTDTPTILLDGVKIPAQSQIDDLEYVVKSTKK